MAVKRVRNKIPWLTLLSALLIMIAGIGLFFVPPVLVESVLLYVLMFVLFIYGIVQAVNAFITKNYLGGIFGVSICWGLAIGIYMSDSYFDFVVSLPSILVGAVSLLLGAIRLMICANCIMNKFPGKVRNGISAFLCITFGILLIVAPIGNMGLLTLVAGFYLIFYSVTMFGDAFAAIFHSDLDSDKQKRRTHFALPNLITAVKPTLMINKINKQLEKGKLDSGMVVEEKKTARFDNVNVEIMVHLTTQGLNKFGHVDIAIGETVYSYGNYDSATVKYGGFVSQGTYIEVPKIPYLKYCLDYQKKYVIGFGVCMSEKQLGVVKKRIEEFKQNCKPIESEYDLAVKENRDGSEYDDPLSNIVRDIGGKVFTVTEGEYSRYFGININCVQFADRMLDDSGIDAISFSGIRTPGAYYSMLDNMFRRKNNRVIRRIWYIKSDDLKYIDKLETVNAEKLYKE